MSRRDLICGVEIVDPTDDDIDHVWRNLRADDRAEVALQGWDDHNHHVLLRSAPYLWCARTDDDEPFTLMGAFEFEETFFIFLLATDRLRQYLKTMTKLVPMGIDYLRRQMFGKVCLVEVWARHAVSVRWLRRLGFVEAPTWRYQDGEKLLLLEYRPTLAATATA